MRGGMFTFNCLVAFICLCGIAGSLVASLGLVSDGNPPVFGYTVGFLFVLVYAILNIFGLDD